MEELRPEYPFFKSSGGGVTFTGGEPTMHAASVAELARSLKRENVHLAMETCGQFDVGGDLRPGGTPGDDSRGQHHGLSGPVWDLLSNIDLVLFDLKVFDDAQQRRLCGRGNADIKRNFHLLATLAAQSRGPMLWPRLPIVPGLTDTKENLEGWARFLIESGLSQLTLVPYHNLGESKRAWLDIKPGPKLKAPIDKAMEAAQRTLARAGITCYLPGEEDWPGSM
jgi:pyruvate formate lyase activating enzyme